MSDSTGTVRFTKHGATAHITLDRPGARNAMTWAMYEQLDAALDSLAQDATIRVAVLRGAGGHFAAGTDISQFAKFESGQHGLDYERQLEKVLSRLESLNAVTLAAVEGFAVGSGLAIATVCDLRICTPDAQFGVPIARTVGNCLSMSNYARLVASFGASRTKRLLFTAGMMSAEEAHAIGYVMEIVEPRAIDARLGPLADSLAAQAPITLQVTKEAIRRIVAKTTADGDDLVERAYASRDFHEGVEAFTAKRPPKWEGR